ncbi:unnamed protein product [Lactuca saligna]|uniref:Myb/SANT-like domain-containing protein n=1 Tax=Lactuca saligna TaxID=75948 RepID=A0AA35Z0B7_LACSI|nr:unnamed protein product [Lactuca saligna]
MRSTEEEAVERGVRFPAKLQETSNDFPPPPLISTKQGIVEVIDFYEAGIVEVLFIITITSKSRKLFTRNMAPTEDRITWNNENIVIFCDVCIDYIAKNRRGQLMRWKEIEDLFTERIGKRYHSKSLKNKYDSMKKDWRIWKFLKTGEPDLGWNPTTGKLDCPDEWWERKLKEKADAKKYRHKGVCPLVEEKWDHLFGDATGVICVAPSLNQEFGLMRENNIQKVHQNHSEIMGLIKKGKDTKKDEVGTSIDEIMDIMNRIVANNDDDVKVGGDIWCHAMLMLRDPTNREIFSKMPSDDARLAWLKFAQTRNIF